MVVSAHPLASQVGIDILKRGGNAFDAAIAVQFALAVVYPRAGNIGGGGFMVYRTCKGKIGSLDFRERAPLLADSSLYLDKKGNVSKGLSRIGILSVAIPGTVDGMVKLHRKLASLPFHELLQPSIRLASSGFNITANQAKYFNKFREKFLKFNSPDCPLLTQDKWEQGDLLVQTQLAKTLQLIQKKGREGFYSGSTAKYIIAQVKRNSGIITSKDLAQYRSVWRTPVTTDYKEYRIITMPPPSSGGIALVQLLQGSDRVAIGRFQHNSAEAIHLMTELERRVFADRATYLGDPDYYNVPTPKLISSHYINNRFKGINASKKTPSEQIRKGYSRQIEHFETTHFSIVDQWTNAIAITTTLNGNFGSKIMVTGAGFFLNNEMDDFSIKPGVPNQFGLIGDLANSIEPGKRMLSSMTPTIVEKNDKLFLVLGSPGGPTIITSVYQILLNIVEYNMSLKEAVTAKRVHSQWQPDYIFLERGSASSIALIKLLLRGHIPLTYPFFSLSLGKVEAIQIMLNKTFVGVADSMRGVDDLALGY
ncbi:MAG: gamma-glutamyltransferase [Spirochaetota bacterium]|nr:gamma-glutamyltransferase [Spirochaetota bacterium]